AFWRRSSTRLENGGCTHPCRATRDNTPNRNVASGKHRAQDFAARTEGAQVEDTIPGDLRGMGEKIQAALDFIRTISLWD
ncbi:hypothetical protein ACP3W1_24650, partial [Salmonella enterica]|uniref:hypothetical protein n=1 Tax=Salmonella enterica TaxID=28901 RepID=UPI003CEC3A4D